MGWTKIKDGLWIGADGVQVLVDDCDCGDEGCPGPADIDAAGKTLRSLGYSPALTYWEAVQDGQPHGQGISLPALGSKDRAQAERGRKGGKASGPAKVRGTADHYRALAAKSAAARKAKRDGDHTA